GEVGTEWLAAVHPAQPRGAVAEVEGVHPIDADQEHVVDARGRRADLTTPHHAWHVAIHTHEAGATRRRRVAGHVGSWGPHGAVGTVVDRAAGPRKNDRGDERKKGSHRSFLSTRPSLPPFHCPNASPCPNPAWIARVRARLRAGAPMPIARRFILSVSSVNPS